MAEECKTQAVVSKEDRISDLPDFLIQHILSFLPSTKLAIQTTVLSKYWQNQWTAVPVLMFHPRGFSFEGFCNFVDKTLILYNCTKIKKFHLCYPYYYGKKKDHGFDEKIRFATSKCVEDLTLKCSLWKEKWGLPECVFSNAFLVKFNIECCVLMPEGKVNWGHLKALRLNCCRLSNQVMEHILSGSRLLELLELNNCEIDKVVITSKSLKILVLQYLHIHVLEISCSSLEGLSMVQLSINDATLFHRAMKNVLSHSLLLESLKLTGINHGQHVIASESLRRLVILCSYFDGFQIFCPKLEELRLKYCNTEICGGFSPLLVKCLTLDIMNSDKFEPGIARVLRNSPVLESLFVNFECYGEKLDGSRKNYWSSNATVFDCLVSHLKTVKIHVFLTSPRLVLNFVQFLLKNSRVLENMAVLVEENHCGDYSIKDFQESLRYPRCSEHVIVELLPTTRKVDGEIW